MKMPAALGKGERHHGGGISRRAASALWRSSRGSIACGVGAADGLYPCAEAKRMRYTTPTAHFRDFRIKRALREPLQHERLRQRQQHLECLRIEALRGAISFTVGGMPLSGGQIVRYWSAIYKASSFKAGIVKVIAKSKSEESEGLSWRVMRLTLEPAAHGVIYP